MPLSIYHPAALVTEGPNGVLAWRVLAEVGGAAGEEGGGFGVGGVGVGGVVVGEEVEGGGGCAGACGGDGGVGDGGEGEALLVSANEVGSDAEECEDGVEVGSFNGGE